MSKGIRKSYDKEFKVKVALAAIRDDKTIAQLASEYGVHTNQVSEWKRLVLESLPSIFQRCNVDKEKRAVEDKTDALYKEIGKLTTRVEFLKKKYRQIYGKDPDEI